MAQSRPPHIDLPDGPLVADGVIVDPIPNSADLDVPARSARSSSTGDGTGATLRQFDPRTQRLGPTITVDGYVSSAISRSGHRIAAGTERGVEIYDGFTGEQVGAIPGTDLRGVFITVTDQLFVSSLGGELTQYDLDTLEPIRTFGGSRGFINQLPAPPTGRSSPPTAATTASSSTTSPPACGSARRSPFPTTSRTGSRCRSTAAGSSLGGEADDGSHATQIWDLDPEHWVDRRVPSGRTQPDPRRVGVQHRHLAPYRATCPELPTDA